MQNRNFIKILAIVFTLICIYQLSFTWKVNSVENDALEFALNPSQDTVLFEKAKAFRITSELDTIEAYKKVYLDDISSKTVYDIFIADYTYSQCLEREINLGLDLKGGMNVTLEVVVADVIKELANNSKDEVFRASMSNTLSAQENSQDNFVNLFASEYEKLAPTPNKGLAVLFASQLKGTINFDDSNEDVIAVLEAEVLDAIERTFNILRSRIDRFGVTQPNIQRLKPLASGRILVELPGIEDTERARKLLQSTAQLGFWETYENKEIFSALENINAYLRENNLVNDSILTVKNDSEDLLTILDSDIEDDVVKLEEEGGLLSDLKEGTDSLSSDSLGLLSFADFALENPWFGVARPQYDQEAGFLDGPVVGTCATRDTKTINVYLKDPEVIKFLPQDVKFAYTIKPFDLANEYVQLVALKVTNRNGKAAMEGDVVEDASQALDQYNKAEVSMSMNKEGSKQWKKITGDNQPKPDQNIPGRSIAIVLDGYVYSYPTVQNEISGGRSSISGQFTIAEAKDLANILKSGKLPAPAEIVEEAIVGPALGKEAISSGLTSFIFALLIVLFYMIFYYNRAGVVSNVALLANIFFIFGTIVSIGTVLTLPGIAGIILTIGMSVDANVLIYERIREELTNGKGIRLAISDGYDSAYSSIIDANVTTLLTGIILYTFGTGPIKGFAATLVIGIITSLFAAIFITRLIISWRLNKGKKMTFSSKLTKGAFKNININFIGLRKRFYILSLIVIILGLGTIFTKGLQLGIDFNGGRNFIVRFDDSLDLKNLKPNLNEDIRKALSSVFIDSTGLKYPPQVKTFGDDNQVKISTSYMIKSKDHKAATVIVENKLNEGLSVISLEDKSISYQIMSKERVGATIADDFASSAIKSIIFSLLVIFMYILLRFRKWQFSLGAVAAVFHDVIIVLSIFSVFYGILPFSLEIDQAFIAAILTIIGYSLNDTVVVFDRVREYISLNKKKKIKEYMNSALNSTLSRTINTSLTTFFVLLIIFIFGGEVIRGFMFALMVGVIVGTYSSLFIAAPIMLDSMREKEDNKK
jgi:SecD/SecF fusion protein